MAQTQEELEIVAITSPVTPRSGEIILDLLHHLRSVAEDDGEAEMAAAVDIALKRCAAIHVRRRQGCLLSSLTGLPDQ